MRALLRYADEKEEELISFIEQLVRCESPSDSPENVHYFVELLADSVRDIAEPQLMPANGYGPNLKLQFRLASKPKRGQILAIGHSDTVWPLGTLRSMPWRREERRLWGPGVLDMKSGLAFFVYAARALRDLDIPVQRNVALLIVSDEEVGSLQSRAITEAEAKQSECVLVLEPGTGLAGKLKTERKGIAGYKLTVEGKAAHAGVDFTAGVSAIVELARQIERMAAFTDLDNGVTLNPGVISGGTRTNVVAAEACVDIDVRVRTAQDAARIDDRLRALQPINPCCRLRLEGGLNRPPMERSSAIAELFDKARQIGAEMGVELEESSTGGGSDGNFTAALGVPTLDGLGGVGEGAHAANESILIDRIADRTALLAGLLSRL